MRIYLILIIASLVVSCNEESKLESEIAKIDANVIIERFDKAELEAKPQDLQKLKQAYPFLFSKRTPDSIWIDRLKDTLQNEILVEVNKVFPDLKNTNQELSSLFRHLKYYDKTFSIPKVVTLTNYVQYRDNIIVTDSIVLIALDNYLGKNHRFYVEGGIPGFLAENFNRHQIVPDIAEAYAKAYVFQTKRKTFLEEMIYFGKLLHFKDVIIPFKTNAEKIGYTEEQLNWAEANEEPIWSYFVEKELLFSSDSKLPNRFIADAPFSKFYLELDNQSPGRLGQYVGWQIVKAYAEKTGKDLMTVLEADPEEIYRKAKFKPKK